jgi:hypothetical protein
MASIGYGGMVTGMYSQERRWHMFYALNSKGELKAPEKGDIGICPWCGEEVGAWMCFAPVTSHFKHGRGKGEICELRELNRLLPVIIAVILLNKPVIEVPKAVVAPRVDRMGNKLYWDAPVDREYKLPPVIVQRPPLVCKDGLVFERIDTREQVALVQIKPSTAFIIDYSIGEYPMKVQKNKRGHWVHMFEQSAECMARLTSRILVKLNDDLFYHPQETYERNKNTGRLHGWGKVYTKQALIERINTKHGGVKCS